MTDDQTEILRHEVELLLAIVGALPGSYIKAWSTEAEDAYNAWLFRGRAESDPKAPE